MLKTPNRNDGNPEKANEANSNPSKVILLKYLSYLPIFSAVTEKVNELNQSQYDPRDIDWNLYTFETIQTFYTLYTYYKNAIEDLLKESDDTTKSVVLNCLKQHIISANLDIDENIIFQRKIDFIAIIETYAPTAPVIAYNKVFLVSLLLGEEKLMRYLWEKKQCKEFCLKCFDKPPTEHEFDITKPEGFFLLLGEILSLINKNNIYQYLLDSLFSSECDKRSLDQHIRKNWIQKYKLNEPKVIQLIYDSVFKHGVLLDFLPMDDRFREKIGSFTEKNLKSIYGNSAKETDIFWAHVEYNITWPFKTCKQSLDAIRAVFTFAVENNRLREFISTGNFISIGIYAYLYYQIFQNLRVKSGDFNAGFFEKQQNRDKQTKKKKALNTIINDITQLLNYAYKFNMLLQVLKALLLFLLKIDNTNNEALTELWPYLITHIKNTQLSPWGLCYLVYEERKQLNCAEAGAADKDGDYMTLEGLLTPNSDLNGFRYQVKGLLASNSDLNGFRYHVVRDAILSNRAYKAGSYLYLSQKWTWKIAYRNLSYANFRLLHKDNLPFKHAASILGRLSTFLQQIEEDIAKIKKHKSSDNLSDRKQILEKLNCNNLHEIIAYEAQEIEKIIDASFKKVGESIMDELQKKFTASPFIINHDDEEFANSRTVFKRELVTIEKNAKRKITQDPEKVYQQLKHDIISFIDAYIQNIFMAYSWETMLKTHRIVDVIINLALIDTKITKEILTLLLSKENFAKILKYCPKLGNDTTKNLINIIADHGILKKCYLAVLQIKEFMDDLDKEDSNSIFCIVEFYEKAKSTNQNELAMSIYQNHKNIIDDFNQKLKEKSERKARVRETTFETIYTLNC